MKLQPLHSNVLLELETGDIKSPAGLSVPESARGDFAYAKVLAVGPGGIDRAGRFVETTVKPGNRVAVHRSSRLGPDNRIALPGEMASNIAMVDEREIVAILVA